jgi:hemoglobin-like flavoprotein
MTPQQVQMIQTTWQSVVPIKEKAAELFYGKLFELDPSLQPLFKGDMKEQGRKLMAMINVVVTNLDKLDTLVPAVQDLGKRHLGYGVTDSHYATVGGALLWTLGAGLGDAFTEEVKGAWAEAYGVLAGVMTEAAATA